MGKIILVLIIAVFITLPVSAAKITDDELEEIKADCAAGRKEHSDPLHPQNFTHSEHLTLCAAADHEGRINVIESKNSRRYKYPDKVQGLYHSYEGSFLGTLMQHSPDSQFYYINFYQDDVYIGDLPLEPVSGDEPMYRFSNNGIYYMGSSCNTNGFINLNDMWRADPDYNGSLVVETINSRLSYIHEIDRTLPYEYTGLVYRLINGRCWLLSGGSETMTFFPIVNSNEIDYGGSYVLITKAIDSIPTD